MIRSLPSENQRVLAARFGVSRTLIRKVLAHEVWTVATCEQAEGWRKK